MTLGQTGGVAGTALLSALLWAAPVPLRGAEPAEAEANRVVEVTFTARQKHPDPFNTLELDVTFTAPDGKAVRVPAFWAGGDVWRVRYSSPQVGTHTYRTRCSDPGDRGLHGREGQVR